jgi:hypothetical protein
MSLVKKSSKVILWFLLLAFLATSNPYLTYSQNISSLPPAGTLLLQSRQFSPVVLKGLRLDPNDPLKFNFIIDTGNDKVDPAFLKDESQRLINYFLAVLATPEDSLWVNLSPYEQNRIIPNGLEATEIGEGMLAQDYVLKQLAASLTYPETEAGKKYWDDINTPSATLRGSSATSSPAAENSLARLSLTKVWIMPKTAVVAETPKGALIIDSSLQVKMEQENPAFRKNILPLIEKEVNQGKNFSQLRQIYSAMVLATWYKVRLKEAILNKAYANKEKFGGIDVADKADKEKIYQQYLKAFQVGAYNYIKRERANTSTSLSVPVFNKIVKRAYFSGGVTADGLKRGFEGVGTKIPLAVVVGLGALALSQVNCATAAQKAQVPVGGYYEVPARVEPVAAVDSDLEIKGKIQDDVKILTEKGVFESVKIDAGMHLMGYSPEKMVLDALEKAIGNKDFTPEEVSYAIWVYVYRLNVLTNSSRQRALDFYRHNKGQFVADWQEHFDAALAEDEGTAPVKPGEPVADPGYSKPISSLPSKKKPVVPIRKDFVRPGEPVADPGYFRPMEPAADDGSDKKETLDLKARKQIENDISTIAKSVRLDDAYQAAALRLLGYVGPKSKPVVLDAVEAAIRGHQFTDIDKNMIIAFYVDKLRVLQLVGYRQRALAFYRANMSAFPNGWQPLFSAALNEDSGESVANDDSGPTKVQAPKGAKKLLNSLTGQDPGSTLNDPHHPAYQRLAAMGDSIVDLLEATLHNDKADTNVRKWAARLLGSVASPSNYERIRKILEDVINDESGKYQWWHKAEARNGLEAAKARIASRSGEKKPSAGGGTGFDRAQAIALIKGLNIQDPAEAQASPQFKKLARMGDAVAPLLKEVAGDLSYNTDVRKWVIYLLGETATKDNASSRVSFLRNVINDSSGVYQWWHAAEAKNAWNALYSKFPGKVPKPPTDHDFNQSIIPSLVVAFYRDEESRARAIRRIKDLIAQGMVQDALDTLDNLMINTGYWELSDGERRELEGLHSEAQQAVGGVKLSGRDLNLQRLGYGGEFKFNNSVSIDFKDGARVLVLEVKPVSNVAQSLGLGN